MATAESAEFGPTGKVEEAEEHRVTPLELFFDLVFVLSFTQVTASMADDPTWTGLGQGMLILAAVWWAWSGYAWLTNAIDPSEDANRLLVFVAMAAMLIVSLAVPGAFGDEAILFGVAYFVVRAVHLLLYLREARREQGDELMSGVLSMAPAWLLSPALIIVAGLFDGTAQVSIWVVALLIDYGSAVVGSSEGYRVHVAHFTERFGLIIIIALGESIVAIGSGAGFAISGLEVVAAVAAIVLAAALWWAYFGVSAIVAERRLLEAPESEQTLLARDSYAFLHLPMIAGIVLLALGIKKTLADVEAPLEDRPGRGALRGRRPVPARPHRLPAAEPRHPRDGAAGRRWDLPGPDPARDRGRCVDRARCGLRRGDRAHRPHRIPLPRGSGPSACRSESVAGADAGARALGVNVSGDVCTRR